MTAVIQSKIRGFSRRELKASLKDAMNRLKVGDYELSLKVVKDAEMIEANKQFFGKDSTTDVIAISQIEGEKMPENELLLGDVIVCWDVARRQAERYGHSTQKELTILAFHGLLHTLGMEDKTTAGRRAMSRKVTRLMRKN